MITYDDICSSVIRYDHITASPVQPEGPIPNSVGGLRQVASYKPEGPKPDRPGGPEEEEAIVEDMKAEETEMEVSKARKQTTARRARRCQRSTKPFKLVNVISLPHFPTYGGSSPLAGSTGLWGTPFSARTQAFKGPG